MKIVATANLDAQKVEVKEGGYDYKIVRFAEFEARQGSMSFESLIAFNEVQCFEGEENGTGACPFYYDESDKDEIREEAEVLEVIKDGEKMYFEVE